MKLPIESQWCAAARAGQKTVEVIEAPLSPLPNKGDIIELQCSQTRESHTIVQRSLKSTTLLVTVTNVTKYKDYSELLDREGLANVSPGYTVEQAKKEYSRKGSLVSAVVAIRFVSRETLSSRNNTSYPVQITAKLRELHNSYVSLLNQNAENNTPEVRVATALKYYQYLVRSIISNPEYRLGESENARGLLIYHAMGMGKTFLAVASAIAVWDVRPPLVIVSKSLRKNFVDTIAKYLAIMKPELSGKELADTQAAAVKRFQFVSLDAYNMATQVARATAGVSGAGSLSGRLLIIDEAHNLFRSIINSASEHSNARKLYQMVMSARNLRILFLTGTPASKDPFELVPCFNMLAGYDLLPTQYETFYKLYVNRSTGTILNRERLSNRLTGLVSYVAPQYPSSPDSGAIAGASREEGGFPEELPVQVVRVEMGEEQYRQYLLARDIEESEGKGSGSGASPVQERITSSAPLALPGSEASSGSTYYVRSRSLSNFAPPRSDRMLGVSEMDDSAFANENSPKIASLISNLALSQGPALIYSQFVGVGGLTTISRFLMRSGFQRWTPELRVSAAVNRYAVISGEVSSEERTVVQKAFNDISNIRGEVIRALLISKTGAEGLDLKGVRQVHLLEPYWDKAREDQVRARGVRLGSHDHLPALEREVQPFLYVSTANLSLDFEAKENEKPLRKLEEITIDEKFHLRGERKKVLNEQFRVLLQKISLECAVNKYGNCHSCLPTDEKLFHADPLRDFSLANPCRPLVVSEVVTSQIELDGTQYNYSKSEDSPFGVEFYSYDDNLEAHTPVDAASGLFMRLYAQLF
jgi:superfamily II DNA or RNA helicase/ASC-1-like (ASCH) protein